jgi:hypothetical protein
MHAQAWTVATQMDKVQNIDGVQKLSLTTAPDFQRKADYQAKAFHSAQLIYRKLNAMTPLRVEATRLKRVAWLGIGFFGLCSIASWRDAFPFWFMFLFFVGLGVFLLLVIGPLEMNDKFIRHTSPLTGCCQMNWDEIEIIEIAPKENGDMVLHGMGKHLAIPGINSGQEKRKNRCLSCSTRR